MEDKRGGQQKKKLENDQDQRQSLKKERGREWRLEEKMPANEQILEVALNVLNQPTSDFGERNHQAYEELLEIYQANKVSEIDIDAALGQVASRLEASVRKNLTEEVNAHLPEGYKIKLPDVKRSTPRRSCSWRSEPVVPSARQAISALLLKTVKKWGTKHEILRKLSRGVTEVEQIIFAQAPSYESYIDRATFETRAIQAFVRTTHLIPEHEQRPEEKETLRRALVVALKEIVVPPEDASEVFQGGGDGEDTNRRGNTDKKEEE
ncbi:unnamed protein product, partial [Scytosiphon promiscuus]